MKKIRWLLEFWLCFNKRNSAWMCKCPFPRWNCQKLPIRFVTQKFQFLIPGQFSRVTQKSKFNTFLEKKEFQHCHNKWETVKTNCNYKVIHIVWTILLNCLKSVSFLWYKSNMQNPYWQNPISINISKELGSTQNGIYRSQKLFVNNS